MPIPFLVPIAIGIASAAAAATGIGAGANAIHKNKQAKSINEDTQKMFDDAKNSAEKAREKSNTSLEQLGQTKLYILDNSMNRFISVFEQIHSIELTNSAELSELRKYRLDKQAVLEMREMSNMANSVLGGMVGGAGAGALAAFGAYGATMTFAAASTGTAIASLSGAAATNATLAFLGGGALAAGGGGMALGSAVLGGVVAGPAIAVLGIAMNASASKNLDNAYSNRSQAREAVEGLHIIETLCNGISARADLFSALLKKLDTVFWALIFRLETIVRQSGCDYSKYTKEGQGVVAMSLSVAGAIKKVLDTPILNEDGSLTDDSLNVHAEMKKYTTTVHSAVFGLPIPDECINSEAAAVDNGFALNVISVTKLDTNSFHALVKVNHAPVRTGAICYAVGHDNITVNAIFSVWFTTQVAGVGSMVHVRLFTKGDADLTGQILYQKERIG